MPKLERHNRVTMKVGFHTWVGIITDDSHLDHGIVYVDWGEANGVRKEDIRNLADIGPSAQKGL